MWSTHKVQEMHLIQQPGIWPQVFVWKPARYDKVPSSVHYKQVQIFCDDEVVADEPIDRHLEHKEKDIMTV